MSSHSITDSLITKELASTPEGQHIYLIIWYRCAFTSEGKHEEDNYGIKPSQDVSPEGEWLDTVKGGKTISEANTGTEQRTGFILPSNQIREMTETISAVSVCTMSQTYFMYEFL